MKSTSESEKNMTKTPIPTNRQSTERSKIVIVG